MPLLFYDCNRQTKSKLEDQNKTSTSFYVCSASLSDEEWTDKEIESIFFLNRSFCASFSCNSMPHIGCLALYQVNRN